VKTLAGGKRLPRQGLVETAHRQRPPLVGRSEELAFCEALLARRDASGVVIAGAAGVGKTRLASEVLAAAEAAGYATVRATATEAGRAIPLGPFAQLLPAEADAAAPLHLLRLARAEITERENGRPVALLVDDAHLLDGASALLVQQLATSREAWVIATVRGREPTPDAVIALWKDHGCAYLELQPLSREETGMLVETLVGGEVDGQTKRRLWEASRGVPLVVRELVFGGLERHALTEHGGLWRWHGPLQAAGRLLELIGARIGQLDHDERELLETVALGEPLTGSIVEARDGAVDALLSRGLIEARRSGRRLELRLAHPLFGESVRARMPFMRAAELQRRLADELEATGMRRPGDLLRVATWRLETGDPAPPELLIEAANVATWLLDSVLAEQLARRAVDVGGGLPAERALARALSGQHRFAEAEEILVALVPKASTDAERASVTLSRAHNLLVGFGRAAEAEAAIVETAQRVSDATLRRELLLARSWVLSRTGRAPEAAQAAIALADDADADLNLRLRAAGIAGHGLARMGRSEHALAVVARWRPLAARAADPLPVPGRAPLLLAQFQGAEILALLYGGRLDEAEVAAHQAYEQGLGIQTAAAAMMALASGLVALAQGRVGSARRWLRESVELLREADPTNSLPWARALSAQALGQSGDHVGARDAIIAAESELLPGPWVYDVDVLLGRAWAAAAEGALTAAQLAALAAADDAVGRGELASAVFAAHDLLRLGDARGAASRLSLLAGMVQGSLVTACAEHAEAVLAADALRLEGAASAFGELGALLWATEAESEAAAAHRQAGREASARNAAARAALLLERCEGARTPALVLAGPVEELTPREREIAALAAGGASNREIAERLVVSVRTVENTLQRTYGKLGVRSRRDLASALRLSE
jgi:DNA-binding CsgD family transcriptional regulator